MKLNSIQPLESQKKYKLSQSQLTANFREILSLKFLLRLSAQNLCQLSQPGYNQLTSY